MTTILKWLNNPYVIAVLLAAGAVTDLVLVGRAYDLGKSDWASWVQAVGSIAAILVAVWIANRDNRKRNHDAYTLALIAAAEMFKPLMDMVKEVLSIHSVIGTSGDPQDTRRRLIEGRKRLSNLKLWSSKEISQLSPLPNHCARRIARAQLQITMFIQMELDDWIIDAIENSSDERRVQAANTMGARVLDIADDLQKALTVVSTSSQSLTKPGEWHLSHLINPPPAQ